MNASEKEEVLKKFYYDAKSPASYAGAAKLFQALKKDYPHEFSLQFIQDWLGKQDSYSLQKQVRHRTKTAQVRVSYINEMWDIDLLSMGNLSEENDGVRFLLFAIDVFSRKLRVQPLKDKTAKSVLKAMKEILKDVKPQKIRSDKGSEFINQWFKKLMKEEDIYFFTTQNPPKANYVERVQRTIKTALYRMMRHRRSYRYIDDLDEIIASYNDTSHRSLNNLTPNQITKDNEADVWAYMYLKKSGAKKKGKPIYRFKVNDLVRISFARHPFRRAYQEQYTAEVFKVSKRFLMQGIPMYKLKDLNDESIKGNFYTSELMKVDKDIDSLWFIEKILKRRRKNKKLQYFVQWDGFPKAFNSWIPADEVKDTTESQT